MAVVDDVLVVGTERERRRVSRPLAVLLVCAPSRIATVVVRRDERTTGAQPPPVTSPTACPGPPTEFGILNDSVQVTATGLRLVVGTAGPPWWRSTPARCGRCPTST